MPPKDQLSLGPLEVKRVDSAPVAQVNEVDLEQAQAAIGRAVLKAITRAGLPLKTFGDKALVSRWCQGQNPNLAKLWMHPIVRRELLIALAEETSFAAIDLTIKVGRIA
jgi:hypothetical protein